MTNIRAINAVPRHFWIMLLSVITVGLWAGNTVVPVFLLTTPALAYVLFRAQVRETHERLFNTEHGLDGLTADARARAAYALSVLRAGEVRELLVGILQMGANARSNLPAGYATSDYGSTIEQLIGAAADTALHAQSFDTTMRALEAQRSATLVDNLDLSEALERVREACDTRVRQLTTALRVLSEIGPDVAEPGDVGSGRILGILDALRREVSEHEAAEREIAEATT
jgi:hypothetical protein